MKLRICLLVALALLVGCSTPSAPQTETVDVRLLDDSAESVTVIRLVRIQIGRRRGG